MKKANEKRLINCDKEYLEQKPRKVTDLGGLLVGTVIDLTDDSVKFNPKFTSTINGAETEFAAFVTVDSKGAQTMLASLGAFTAQHSEMEYSEEHQAILDAASNDELLDLLFGHAWKVVDRKEVQKPYGLKHFYAFEQE